jgi:hypothetical protein
VVGILWTDREIPLKGKPVLRLFSRLGGTRVAKWLVGYEILCIRMIIQGIVRRLLDDNVGCLWRNARLKFKMEDLLNCIVDRLLFKLRLELLERCPSPVYWLGNAVAKRGKEREAKEKEFREIKNLPSLPHLQWH